MIPKLNITDFLNTCNREFLLFLKASSLKDGRKAPRIEAPKIFFSLFLMPLLKLRSLLQLDQALRLPPLRRLIKASPSDSTIDRSLRSFDLPLLRQTLHSLYLRAEERGLCTYHLGSRKLKIGILDGSKFGHFYASCFQVVGKADIWVDLKVIPRWGKELPTSKQLIGEMVRRFGKGFVDVLLLDGLYFDREIFLLKREAGVEVVIKTDEARLDIIQDAEGLFRSPHFQDEIEYVEGEDRERGCRYKVYCCGGFSYHDLDFKLKVALVEEEYKRGRRERFYVISTWEELGAEELRELGHLRWEVENNGFKALNQLTNCDHVWTHDGHAFEALMLIFFLVWDCLEAFLAFREGLVAGIREMLGKVKVTRRFIWDLLFLSFLLWLVMQLLLGPV